MSCSVISFSGIYSVWRRYAYVYRKTWLINCLPPMSEPVVYLLAFGLGLAPLIRSFSYLGNQVDYLRFIAPGMIAIGVMYQSYFEGSYGPFVRFTYQRTWQALLTTPLTFAEIYVSELIWAATKGTIAGVLTGSVALLWGIYPLSSFIAGLPLIVFGSVLFGAAGMCTAGVAKTINHINIPVFMFITPMFVFCGTYFPREGLPYMLRIVTNLLPLSGLVDLLRWQMGLPESIWLEGVVMLTWALFFIWVSWKLLLGKVIK
jgi:lipooligosaccharide transport system permease protein